MTFEVTSLPKFGSVDIKYLTEKPSEFILAYKPYDNKPVINLIVDDKIVLSDGSDKSPALSTTSHSKSESLVAQSHGYGDHFNFFTGAEIDPLDALVELYNRTKPQFKTVDPELQIIDKKLPEAFIHLLNWSGNQATKINKAEFDPATKTFTTIVEISEDPIPEYLIRYR